MHAIKTVMAQILEVEPHSIGPSSSPETIPRWDSLKHMQLVLALEDELGVRFPDDVIPNLLSLEAIESAVAKLSEK